MAVCSPQELISENPCLTALNPHMRRVVKVQMLCGLFNNLDSGEPLTCDIQELIDDAGCFYNLSDDMLEVIELQLLCNIFSLL